MQWSLIPYTPPQDSVLSPALFNFFVSDFSSQSQLTASFANDFTIGESSHDLDILTPALNADLAAIALWAKSKNLTIATNKSNIILFTFDTHQSKHHPQVTLNGTVIPWTKTSNATNIQKLQVVQNSALRLVTSAVRKTSVPHLHRETKAVPSGATPRPPLRPIPCFHATPTYVSSRGYLSSWLSLH
jgi:branched-subunit amino acid transport protein